MGQKVHPFAFRLGPLFDWKSRWFNKRKYTEYLEEDTTIRAFLAKKLKNTGLQGIEIERSANLVKITIRAARPGLIIGRAGTGIEELRKSVAKTLNKIPRRPWSREAAIAKTAKAALGAAKEKRVRPEIKLTVEELKKPELYAAVVAQDIADQFEKRIPFRRVLKQTIERVMYNKEVEGIKISVAGRLDGSEMARFQWMAKGKIPLQNLRANIDFAEATAFTVYGTSGIKVWIYKGEVFKGAENPKI